MLPEKPIYSEFAGQAVALPALLDLLQLGVIPRDLHTMLCWMGRWDLLWIGTNDAEEAVPVPCACHQVDAANRAAEVAYEEERQALLERSKQNMDRLAAMSAALAAPSDETEFVPLDPGGCPAAQELADGTPASEGASCESGQDVEGGGVIPSPSPAPDAPEDDDDGAWLIEDEADPAAPTPPCAADEGVPSVATEEAPAPAEAVPEAAPARDRQGQPWTVEEDALALSLRNAGVPVREISTRLGRPYWAMHARFGKLKKTSEKLGGERGGLQRLDPAEHDPVQGTTAEDAAPPVVPEAARVERPGWWDGTLTLYRSIGSKGGWTAARDLVLVDGRLKELPWPVIADELGCEGRDARARFIALTPDGESPAQLKQLAELLKFLAADHGV